MRESQELRELLLFLEQEIGASYRARTLDLIVSRLKIDYHKIVDH